MWPGGHGKPYDVMRVDQGAVQWLGCQPSLARVDMVGRRAGQNKASWTILGRRVRVPVGSAEVKGLQSLPGPPTGRAQKVLAAVALAKPRALLTGRPQPRGDEGRVTTSTTRRGVLCA